MYYRFAMAVTKIRAIKKMAEPFKKNSAVEMD
jgi:hypothetical protein